MPNQNSSISNFKKFCLRILFPLLVIVGTVSYSINYFFEKNVILGNASNGAYKVNRIISQNNAEEIPIFGSSRALNGFAPTELGSNYFNYGLAGTKYDVTLFFLEEECKKKKTYPQMLINLDFESFFYGYGDIGNYLYNSQNASVKQLLGKDYKFYYGVPVLKYYGQFEAFSKGMLNNKMQFTKIYDNGAELEKNVLTVQRFDELVKLRLASKYNFGYDTSLVSKMKKIIHENPLRKFVFIISPYHKSVFEAILNQGKIDSLLGILKNEPNASVINFGNKEYADSEFVNTSHLNYIGAMRFSRELKDTLEKLSIK